jgi:hypothetical protein
MEINKKMTSTKLDHDNIKRLQRDIADWRAGKVVESERYDDRGVFWVEMSNKDPERYKKEIQGHAGFCCATHGCKLGLSETCPVWWDGSLSTKNCKMCLDMLGSYINNRNYSTETNKEEEVKMTSTLDQKDDEDCLLQVFRKNGEKEK